MFAEFLFTAEIFPLTGSKKGIEEMLDIKFVRENPEIVKQNIRNKFQDKKLHLVDEVIELDKKNREIKQEVEALRASPAHMVLVSMGAEHILQLLHPLLLHEFLAGLETQHFAHRPLKNYFTVANTFDELKQLLEY